MFKNPDKDGYPFPHKPGPNATRLIYDQVSKALQTYRKEKKPPANVKPMGKQAVVKEEAVPGGRQITMHFPPPTRQGGNNSSF